MLVYALVALDIDWTPVRVLMLPMMVVSGAAIFSAVFVAGAAFQFWAQDAAEVQNSFTYGGTTLLQYPPTVFGKDLVRGVTFVVPLAFVNWLAGAVCPGPRGPVGASGRGRVPAAGGGGGELRAGGRRVAGGAAYVQEYGELGELGEPGEVGPVLLGQLDRLGQLGHLDRADLNQSDRGGSGRIGDRVEWNGALMSTSTEGLGGDPDFIELDGIEKVFDVRRRAGLLRREKHQVRAVDGISFRVPRGEMVGYIGPNGAGKSTTIKMLTGILTPSGGRLRVAGIDPSRERTRLAQRIGVVFGQRTTLWWDLPLIDSYQLMHRMYRVPDARFRVNLERCVELLDLAALLDVPVRQLSLGQRMRGDIAAALLHDPEVLYLDEPTIGLDVVSKAKVRSSCGT